MAPGTYYYKEIKAPKLPDGADYIIYPELVKVEIRGDFKGDPEIFQLGPSPISKDAPSLRKLMPMRTHFQERFLNCIESKTGKNL